VLLKMVEQPGEAAVKQMGEEQPGEAMVKQTGEEAVACSDGSSQILGTKAASAALLLYCQAPAVVAVQGGGGAQQLGLCSDDPISIPSTKACAAALLSHFQPRIAGVQEEKVMVQPGEAAAACSDGSSEILGTKVAPAALLSHCQARAVVAVQGRGATQHLVLCSGGPN